MTERYKAQASLLRDVLQAQTAVEQATTNTSRPCCPSGLARAEFEKAMGEDQ
jgi:hypothetical protein